jgi:nucleotide-binding universal stress UspA family protein
MRNLLTIATQPDHRAPALAYAVRMAASLRANLTALCACQPEESLPHVRSVLDMPEVIAYIRDYRHAATAEGPKFVEWARRQGVEDPVWQVARDHGNAILAEIAAWHDLLVLKRDSTPEGSANSIGQQVIASNLPSLVFPLKASEPGSTFPRIAIAYNGAVESVRALTAALPFLLRAESVVLLSGQPSLEPAAAGHFTPRSDPREWLTRNDVVSSTHELIAQPGYEGSALLEAATAVEADLLVMGAYGHSRLSEWIFGGATRHVLEHASIPLLMHH